MKAWTKPKEVDWFEYTGVTDAFRQWCSEVGLVLKDREGDPHIRVRDEDIEDVESSLPMTLYNSVCLPSCIIVKSGSCISRMPKEHFEDKYLLVNPRSIGVERQPYQGAFFNEALRNKYLGTPQCGESKFIDSIHMDFSGVEDNSRGGTVIYEADPNPDVRYKVVYDPADGSVRNPKKYKEVNSENVYIEQEDGRYYCLSEHRYREAWDIQDGINMGYLEKI